MQSIAQTKDATAAPDPGCIRGRVTGDDARQTKGVNNNVIIANQVLVTVTATYSAQALVCLAAC
jgi:hypothetical protein